MKLWLQKSCYKSNNKQKIEVLLIIVRDWLTALDSRVQLKKGERRRKSEYRRRWENARSALRRSRSESEEKKSIRERVNKRLK